MYRFKKTINHQQQQQNSPNQIKMEFISSEYVREKVLFKCRDKFIRDFEFTDIHRDLSNANVLPLTDLDMIARNSTRDDQVDALFFLLVIRGDDVFNAFKYQLRTKYDWLYQDIERAEHIERDITTSHLEYWDKLLELRKELPKFVDYNIHRCDLVNEEFIVHASFLKTINDNPFNFTALTVYLVRYSIRFHVASANTSNDIGLESTPMPCSAWQPVAGQTMDRDGCTVQLSGDVSHARQHILDILWQM